ncbi:helix-turn-helix domain-containing protein [Anaerotignum sp.]|uniref:helix-turn-helix domain-containing protein n=1 Tax=Anaerotignum sp. TaxID=2039241 RepID=UPI0027BAE0F0|nr:helix-turn-helix transcriptional regulator [Anaerotignum sp.]
MEIYDRVKYLRKDFLHLTQDEFSKKLNISRANVANIESGRVSITERTVQDICRIFSINEDWLRFGHGDIERPPMGKGNELVELIADLVQTDDDFSKQFIIEYLKLSDDEKEVIKKIMRNVKEYL